MLMSVLYAQLVVHVRIATCELETYLDPPRVFDEATSRNRLRGWLR